MYIYMYVCVQITALRSHVLVKPIGPHFLFIYPIGFTKHVKFTLSEHALY